MSALVPGVHPARGLCRGDRLVLGPHLPVDALQVRPDPLGVHEGRRRQAVPHRPAEQREPRRVAREHHRRPRREFFAFQPLRKAPTLDKAHRQKPVAVAFPKLMHRHDIGMVERGRRPGLVMKPLDEFRRGPFQSANCATSCWRWRMLRHECVRSCGEAMVQVSVRGA